MQLAKAGFMADIYSILQLHGDMGLFIIVYIYIIDIYTLIINILIYIVAISIVKV